MVRATITMLLIQISVDCRKEAIARAMGKTMTSTSYQTPRAKGRRRSSLLGLGKMLGKMSKMGKKMLGPVSYGSRRVSSCLKSVNSPAAQRRRSGNCMAERTVYREVRKERLNNYLVREGVENIKWRRGEKKISLFCIKALNICLFKV